MQNHQQALLVVLSYIIGFITAFIMFGLADFGKDREEVHLNQVPEDRSSDREAVIAAPRLTETEEGLFLVANGGRQIINAFTDDEVAEPGFHVAIITTSLSPDNKYVLYCAQMDAASEACHHFIYSLDDHKTYLVKHEDGTSLVTGNDEADSLHWTSDTEVTISGKTASTESNWMLR